METIFPRTESGCDYRSLRFREMIQNTNNLNNIPRYTNNINEALHDFTMPLTTKHLLIMVLQTPFSSHYWHPPMLGPFCFNRIDRFPRRHLTRCPLQAQHEPNFCPHVTHQSSSRFTDNSISMLMKSEKYRNPPTKESDGYAGHRYPKTLEITGQVG